MRKRLLLAPPQLPDGWMYDINPGSNEVVPAELIQQECRNAMKPDKPNEPDWDHYLKDPAYWWRKTNEA